MVDNLRTAIIVDYQNVHLTAHGLFAKNRPAHEVLVHPLRFANQLLYARNERQRGDMPHASLSKVLVYRGQPSSEHDPKAYDRNLAQKAEWERSQLVTVHPRPLKYTYEYDEDGFRVTDAYGKLIVKEKREKGIDVLCALAVVREARQPDIDLVILASQDSDLEPSLDEALDLHTAKIETFCWWDPQNPKVCRQLRPTDRRRVLWNTRLDSSHFSRCWDPTSYK